MELTATDVETFTGGRLADDGGTGEVTNMLNAALTAARRYCGWHVTPQKTGDTVTLDGPCSRQLMLPTRRLVTLTSIVENGITLDLATLAWSGGSFYQPNSVVVRKNSGGFWSCDYKSIAVTMTHGYLENEAVDWRRAVLSMVDQMSLLPLTAGAERSNADLVDKKVDDVQYRWSPLGAALAEEVLYSVSNVFDNYRLAPVYLL